MIECAVRINDSLWQDWLAVLAKISRLTAVECDLDLFSRQPQLLRELSRAGVKCLYARDLLPADTAAFVTAAADAGKQQFLREKIFNLMVCASVGGARFFSLQLRLDRPEYVSSGVQLLELGQFLQGLMSAPLEPDFAICLPVRQPPPFPASSEWVRARELCQLVDDVHLGLCLNFYPEDFFNAGELDRVLDECQQWLKIVCFHYDPQCGETLYDDEQMLWCEQLKKRHFQGLVSFCPKTGTASNIDNLCQNIASWTDYYA